jgi:hypothetical protein
MPAAAAAAAAAATASKKLEHDGKGGGISCFSNLFPFADHLVRNVMKK